MRTKIIPFIALFIMTIALIFISPPNISAAVGSASAGKNVPVTVILIAHDNVVFDEANAVPDLPAMPKVVPIKITNTQLAYRGNYRTKFDRRSKLFSPPKDQFIPHYNPPQSVLQTRKQPEIVRMM